MRTEQSKSHEPHRASGDVYLAAGVVGSLMLAGLISLVTGRDASGNKIHQNPVRTHKPPLEKVGGHQLGVDTTSHLRTLTHERGVVLNRK